MFVIFGRNWTKISVFSFYWLETFRTKESEIVSSAEQSIKNITENVPDKEGFGQACALIAVETTRQWSELVHSIFPNLHNFQLHFLRSIQIDGIDFWLRRVTHIHQREWKIACLGAFRKFVKMCCGGRDAHCLFASIDIDWSRVSNWIELSLGKMRIRHFFVVSVFFFHFVLLFSDVPC